MNPNIQIKTVVVAANGVTDWDATGSTLLFVSNTGPFNFALDGGNFNPGFSILSIDVSRNPVLLGSVSAPALVAPQFNTIKFKDTSGAQNTITFIVANYPVTYANPVPTVVQKDAPTYTKGTVVAALANNATSAVFNGTDVATGKTRKQFTVTNNDPAQELQVLDGNGVVFGTVEPKTPWTHESNGSFQLKNASGADLTMAPNVGETFYV